MRFHEGDGLIFCLPSAHLLDALPQPESSTTFSHPELRADLSLGPRTSLIKLKDKFTDVHFVRHG